MIRLAGLAKNFAKVLKENENGFDYKYFKGQIDSLSNTLMEFEQELSTNLETIADNPAAMGSVSAEQARNQASRYIIGAEKQLESLSTMLDRLESQGEF